MSSSGGEWIVTMDEDGQHDPAYIGAHARSGVRDAVPARLRRSHQRAAARRAAQCRIRDSPSGMFQWLVGDCRPGALQQLSPSSSARSAAAQPPTRGPACTSTSPWHGSCPTCHLPIPMRSEGRPASNYSLRKLVSHFGRLVISSGTRPLALVSLIGLLFLALGILVYSVWVLANRFLGDYAPQGWTSTFVSILIVGGLTLFSLGVIAQYIRAATNMSLGKPLYVVVRDPGPCSPPNRLRPDAERLMLAWIVGSGGMLGSSIAHVARGRATLFRRPACRGETSRPFETFWHRTCIASPPKRARAGCHLGSRILSGRQCRDRHRRELDSSNGLLDALGASPPSGRGAFFLTSSAGGRLRGVDIPPLRRRVPSAAHQPLRSPEARAGDGRHERHLRVECPSSSAGSRTSTARTRIRPRARA